MRFCGGLSVEEIARVEGQGMLGTDQGDRRTLVTSASMSFSGALGSIPEHGDEHGHWMVVDEQEGGLAAVRQIGGWSDRGHRVHRSIRRARDPACELCAGADLSDSDPFRVDSPTSRVRVHGADGRLDLIHDVGELEAGLSSVPAGVRRRRLGDPDRDAALGLETQRTEPGQGPVLSWKW
jgi:hypothetical protein